MWLYISFIGLQYAKLRKKLGLKLTTKQEYFLLITDYGYRRKLHVLTHGVNKYNYRSEEKIYHDLLKVFKNVKQIK